MLHTTLLLSGKLNSHLAEIDNRAVESTGSNGLGGIQCGGVRMNVLEDSWYGNIVPAEYDSSPSKEYRERIQLISIDCQAPKHNSGAYNQTPA